MSQFLKTHVFFPCPIVHGLWPNLELPTYLATLDIQATLCENLHVDTVSLIFIALGESVAIIDVRQLPPKLSLSIIVNSELRYGTNLLLGLV